MKRDIESIDFSNQLVIYRNAFTEDECNFLKKSFDIKSSQVGFYSSDENKFSLDKSPLLTYIEDNEKNIDILEQLRDYIRDFNNSFQFEIEYDFTDSSVLKYTKGKKTLWHQDIGPYPFSLRKISSILMLSDQSEYLGGHLEIITQETNKIDLNKGDLCVFIPYLAHRVSDIIDGERYSMVSFFSGKEPFK